MSDARSLAEALDHLAAVAAECRVDAASARDEAIRLAAAVAENNRQAFVDWADALEREPSAEAFMVAAQTGRRWRMSPTPLMQEVRASQPDRAKEYASALAQVCTSAAMLGEPSSRSMGNAQSAASAQLGASSGTSTMPTSETPDAGVLRRVLDQLQGTIARQQDLATSLGRSPLDLDSDVLGPGAFTGLPGSPAPQEPAAPPESQGQEPQATAPQQPASQDDEEPPTAPEETRSVEELLAELDELIGLERVKSEIHQQSAVLRVEGLRKEAGLNVPTVTRHLVFVGNPGTGKTTVARLVAGIYKALGLLSKGQLIEVDRSELVAGYVGQTALKTAKVAESAKGGVLFIDEAYSLSGDQYGTEAINTLVKEMEDNRDDLVVIVAGYPRPMEVFIAENPGLASRFRTTIAFDDYTDDELVDIFTTMVAKADYDASDETVERFRTILGQQRHDETFGNGRFARNCLEAAIGAHAWRLRDVESPTVEDLRTLVPEDLDAMEVPEADDELPDLSLFQEHIGRPLEAPEDFEESDGDDTVAFSEPSSDAENSQ